MQTRKIIGSFHLQHWKNIVLTWSKVWIEASIPGLWNAVSIRSLVWRSFMWSWSNLSIVWNWHFFRIWSELNCVCDMICSQLHSQWRSEGIVFRIIWMYFYVWDMIVESILWRIHCEKAKRTKGEQRTSWEITRIWYAAQFLYSW